MVNSRQINLSTPHGRLNAFVSNVFKTKKAMTDYLKVHQTWATPYTVDGVVIKSKDILDNLSKKGLNVDWYLTGNGDMLNKNIKIQNMNNVVPPPAKDGNLIPALKSTPETDLFMELLARMNSFQDVKNELSDIKQKHNDLEKNFQNLNENYQNVNIELRTVYKRLKTSETQNQTAQAQLKKLETEVKQNFEQTKKTHVEYLDKMVGIFEEQHDKNLFYKKLEASGKYFTRTEIGDVNQPKISAQRMKTLMQYARIILRKDKNTNDKTDVPYTNCLDGDTPLAIKRKSFLANGTELYTYIYHKERTWKKIFNRLKKDGLYEKFANCQTKSEIDRFIDGLSDDAPIMNTNPTPTNITPIGIFEKTA